MFVILFWIKNSSSFNEFPSPINKPSFILRAKKRLNGFIIICYIFKAEYNFLIKFITRLTNPATFFIIKTKSAQFNAKFNFLLLTHISKNTLLLALKPDIYNKYKNENISLSKTNIYVFCKWSRFNLKSRFYKNPKKNLGCNKNRQSHRQLPK